MSNWHRERKACCAQHPSLDLCLERGARASSVNCVCVVCCVRAFACVKLAGLFKRAAVQREEKRRSLCVLACTCVCVYTFVHVCVYVRDAHMIDLRTVINESITVSFSTLSPTVVQGINVCSRTETRMAPSVLKHMSRKSSPPDFQ